MESHVDISTERKVSDDAKREGTRTVLYFKRTHPDTVVELQELSGRDTASSSMSEIGRRGSDLRLTIRNAELQTQHHEDHKSSMSSSAKVYKFFKQRVCGLYELNLPNTWQGNLQLIGYRGAQLLPSLYQAWMAYTWSNKELASYDLPEEYADEVTTFLSTLAMLTCFVIMQNGIGYGMHRVSTWESRVENLEKESKQNKNAVIALTKAIEISPDLQTIQNKMKQLLPRMKSGDSMKIEDEPEDQSYLARVRRFFG